ncbi:MAG: PKHD-type hydroxylase [Saprospiraceae bacterium]|jgi:PKHD-type hydroxylase
MAYELDKILKFWDDDKRIKATLSGEAEYNDDLRKSAVMFIDHTPEYEWIYQKLASLAVQCNNERYWFDLLGFHQELFPSFIIHRVTPITKGTRQSIVGWVSGPPYR